MINENKLNRSNGNEIATILFSVTAVSKMRRITYLLTYKIRSLNTYEFGVVRVTTGSLKSCQ